MNLIIITVIVSFVLAFILGVLLGFFKKIFAVPVDEKVEAIRACLPGANCGGCGYPGCDGFAAACAKGEAPANGCVAGGETTAKAVGEVLGVKVSADKKVTMLACQGTKACAAPRGFYNGVKTCAGANIAINGTKMCAYGCIGFGDCVNACSFGALSMGEDGIPKVDYKKCTGCGACLKACPKKLFKLVDPKARQPMTMCSNRSAVNPSLIKNCKSACIKCGNCVRTCPQEAITIINGIPEVDYSKCTGCRACVLKCPTKALQIIDEKTVAYKW